MSRSSVIPQGADAMFDYVISPLTRDSFLADFWGRSFLHRPGNPGKFASLLPWSELNGVLEQHELEPPRFRLFQDGKAVDQARFTSILDGARRLRSRDFVQCLAKGATLIVDRMDELSPSVRRLAEAFEDVLRAPTCVNLYAGWRTQKGLDLHWDSQDTLILQISGRKHWRVYAPTRLHPLRADVGKVPTPTAQPVWDSILADGDAIYLPRGWWHVAFPVNEPSLHLTVTVLPSHGVDVLEWLVR
ncbi:MAG TPA: cupin domain-containing protein, partial [Candidatus Methylomirabilis sp.]|nr:cupin domain-containing protein [Candidatus Methylomirabilis sp.]